MTSTVNVEKRCMSNMLSSTNVYFGGQHFYLELPEIDLVYVELDALKEKLIKEVSACYNKTVKMGFAINDKEVLVSITQKYTKNIIGQLIKKAEGHYKPEVAKFLSELYDGRKIIKFVEEADAIEARELEKIQLSNIEHKEKADFNEIVENMIKEFKEAFVFMPMSDYVKLKKFIMKKAAQIYEENKESFEKPLNYIRGYNIKEKAEAFKEKVDTTKKRVAWKLLKADYKFKKNMRVLKAEVEVQIGNIKEKMNVLFNSKNVTSEKYIKHELFEMEDLSSIVDVKKAALEEQYEQNSIEFGELDLEEENVM
ncbi:MAG: hypothetical protein N4A47_05000 [Clostridia bacterium]|jgi:hypothetical protein|nr:hypothetical protein [Clostridia bacterium]